MNDPLISVFVRSFVQQVAPMMMQLWWFWLLGLVVAVMRTAWFKGMFGEWLVHQVLKRSFKEPDYLVVWDVLLPTRTGTTQIDHLVVSRYGIFVIETKNMKGWIFGRAADRQWTQQIYKRKYKFLNPIQQNASHVKALAPLADIAPDYFHFVVVFVGEAKIKSACPSNVMKPFGLRRYIKRHTHPIIEAEALSAFQERLTQERLPNTRANRRQHIKHVKKIQKRATARRW